MNTKPGKTGIFETLRRITGGGRTHIETGPGCIARIDKEGIFIDVSDSCAQIFGYGAGELKGTSLRNLVLTDDLEEYDSAFAELIASGYSERELRSMRADGAVFHLNMILTSAGSGEKNHEGGFCLISDITAARQSRLLLQLEQKILRQIAGGEEEKTILMALCLDIQSMLDGSHCVISTPGNDGNYLTITVDPGSIDTSALDSSRLPIGENSAGCGTAAFRQEMVIVDDAETSPLWAGFRQFAADNNIRASWSNPIFSRSGDILGVFGVTLDRPGAPSEIETELLKVAGYLASITMDYSRERDTLQRYEEMVRSSRDMMVYIDRDYTYKTVSNSYAHFYGLNKEDIIGRHISEIIGRDAFDSAIKSNLDQSLKGKAVDWEGWMYSTVRPTYRIARYDPIFEKGEVIGIVVVVRDSTEEYLTEEALRESEERFALAMQGVNDGLWDWNPDTNQAYFSPIWGKMLGYSDTEYTGSFDDFYPLVHPDDRESVRSALENFLQGSEDRFEMEFRLLHSDGHYLDILSRGFGVRNTKTGGMKRVIGINADITERKQAEMRIQESERRFRSLYDDSPTMFFTLDTAGAIISVNQFGADHLGYAVDEMTGRDILDFTPPEDIALVTGHIEKCSHHRGSVQHCEFRIVHKYGDPVWVRAAMRLISWKDSREILVSCEDITETRILSEQLEYQAKHDSLTGLINRAEFERRLRRILNVRSLDNEHAMCFLDLDQFKIINDTCGHLAGDELLRRVSHTLDSVVRKRDTLARLGGDEFAVLLEYCPLEQARRVAGDMLNAVQSLRFSWEGKSFNIGVTIGLVPISENSGTVTDVLSAADAACYAAKDAGRNRIHVYRQDDLELSRRRTEMRWVSEINQALEESRFRLARQPILALDPEKSSGKHYELLIRMQDKDGSIIFPGAFLAAAERYNLSTRLDRWVIATTFEWLQADAEERESLQLCAINLSGHSLGDPDFLQFLLEQFQTDFIEAEKFCFEITETAAIANLGEAIHFIKTLKEIGCSFSLDDFGTGLSSFNYLKNLPVDFLKIDGSFVREIAGDPIDQAMVRSINDIGHVMGKKTIAEFVEDDEILQLLREIGVDYAQGFGLGRPELLELGYQGNPGNTGSP